jgi:hypothetical protein
MLMEQLLAGKKFQIEREFQCGVDRVTKAKVIQVFALHFHPLVSIEFYIISMDALDSLTPQQKDVLEQFQVIYSNLSNLH